MPRDDHPAPDTSLHPVQIRRLLAATLRLLRVMSGATQLAVAEKFEWSPSKILRAETAATVPSITDLRYLLRHYGVPDGDLFETLLDAARIAKKAPATRTRQNGESAVAVKLFTGVSYTECFQRATGWLTRTDLAGHLTVLATNITYRAEEDCSCQLAIVYSPDSLDEATEVTSGTA